jgi:hypothetical protein
MRVNKGPWLQPLTISATAAVAVLTDAYSLTSTRPRLLSLA